MFCRSFNALVVESFGSPFSSRLTCLSGLSPLNPVSWKSENICICCFVITISSKRSIWPTKSSGFNSSLIYMPYCANLLGRLLPSPPSRLVSTLYFNVVVLAMSRHYLNSGSKLPKISILSL